MQTMRAIDVTYRCHLCAPSVVWANERIAAIQHMRRYHNMTILTADDYLKLYRLSSDDPDFNELFVVEAY